MRPFFESGGTLRWSPIRAEVSGDLGYTVGTYVSESPAPDGSPNSGQGMYVTIWRRGPDGVWKAVVDLGNPTEAVDQTPGG
jgi:ketosteroid isomerase-like protein